METLQQIIEKLETYHFECQAGPLENCTDWQALTTRCERLAEAVDEWSKDYFELQVTAMMLFDMLDRQPWTGTITRRQFLDRIVPLDEVTPEDVDRALDLLRAQAEALTTTTPAGEEEG